MKMSGVCLQIDVGNSGAKWRLVRAGTVTNCGKYRAGNQSSLGQLYACADVLDHIWVSSVASPGAEVQLTELLVEKWGVQPWYARTQAQTNGLTNSYTSPALMGVDRWLAMLGARERVTGRICVVDVGSALTIDIVDEKGLHEGGYIIPGSELMERALLLDTDRVRFEEGPGYDLAPGKSTAEAVRHGIALAQAGAVRMVLDKTRIAGDKLLMCGGGGRVLQSLLGGPGVYVADLVFEGLSLMATSEYGGANTGAVGINSY